MLPKLILIDFEDSKIQLIFYYTGKCCLAAASFNEKTKISLFLIHQKNSLV